MKKNLDAKKDADEVFHQMAIFEFPFMLTKASHLSSDKKRERRGW